MSSSLTTGAVPPPPDPLECNNWVLKAGTIIHRVHDRQFGAMAFNPGKGNSRFAPFAVGGTPIPTAYAATSFECAAFETIFHDIAPTERFKSVYWSSIEPLVYSTMKLGRDVPLAPLFSADLMKFGVERGQLIDTPKSTYPQTRAWSPAIHEAVTRPEGMVWTSKRYDQEKAIMLFGSRVSTTDLLDHVSVDITTDPNCLAVLQEISQRTGIDIIR
jgi:hypothetical protein